MELPLHIEAFGTTTRLSFHVEPILLLISLIYHVVAGPPVLLILQALVVALGALPLSWLARDYPLQQASPGRAAHWSIWPTPCCNLRP